MTGAYNINYLNLIAHNPNTNDHCKNLVPLSTDLFVAMYYSPKIGGIG
jgi:hypothetical protein